ncbi:MAG TPA: enoyl-CoA hydratase-related protein [Candidatus Acidoferrum sp.]|nr:enoyl-CoA hydratase-related protein [Candidatus Acidoferrum sp.]
MSAPGLVRTVWDGAVARVTLCRPPLNVLTIPMMEELNAALDDAAGRPALKAVLLAADGKAFSAGVDVQDHMGERVQPMLEAFHGIFRRLHALDCVTVAAVQGAALGGGAELATFCDLVIASERATLGQPEIKVGVFPPIAALHYPVRVGPHRALQLLLSGDVLDAGEALRIGLVDRVVPADRLAETVEAALARFTAHSAAVLRLTKRAVRQAVAVPFDLVLGDLEALYRDELMVTDDAREGLRAFAEKRQPVWVDH